MRYSSSPRKSIWEHPHDHLTARPSFLMLVGYSSSSEETEGETQGETEGERAAFNDKKKRRPRTYQGQEEDEDDSPARKKSRTEEQLSGTRLPIPGSLLEMFQEEAEPETEEPSLHGGRIRSFKHERGNWATYVYVPYDPEEEFVELLEELLSVAGAHGVTLTQQEEYHLSLSRTVVLRHHWIQAFTQSLKTGLAHCSRCVCFAGILKVYCNAEKTRTFLGMEVSSGHAQLLELVKVVDKSMTEFHLDTFYKDPSFHVSLAWCVGDATEQMEGFLQELQSLVDDHEEGPLMLAINCTELHCRAGNKTFTFPLEA